MCEPIDLNSRKYVIFKQNYNTQMIGEKNGIQCIMRKCVIKFKNGTMNVFYAGYMIINKETGKMVFESPVMRCMNSPSEEMLKWVNS